MTYLMGKGTEVTVELRHQDGAELQEVLTLANGGRVLDAGLWAEMKEQRDGAVAEIERLQEIVDKLSKSATKPPRIRQVTAGEMLWNDSAKEAAQATKD